MNPYERERMLSNVVLIPYIFAFSLIVILFHNLTPHWFIYVLFFFTDIFVFLFTIYLTRYEVLGNVSNYFVNLALMR